MLALFLKSEALLSNVENSFGGIVFEVSLCSFPLLVVFAQLNHA